MTSLNITYSVNIDNTGIDGIGGKTNTTAAVYLEFLGKTISDTKVAEIKTEAYKLVDEAVELYLRNVKVVSGK